MSMGCVPIWISGVVLLVGWVVTIVLYFVKRSILAVAYEQAQKIVPGAACTGFYALETLAVLSWLILGIVCVTDTDDYASCTWSMLFFAGSCVFVLGTCMWPLALTGYTHERVAFPTAEEIATTTAAAGVGCMLVAAYSDSGIHRSQITVIVFVTYMAAHYGFVDAVLWPYTRWRMHTSKQMWRHQQHLMRDSYNCNTL